MAIKGLKKEMETIESLAIDIERTVRLLKDSCKEKDYNSMREYSKSLKRDSDMILESSVFVFEWTRK